MRPGANVHAMTNTLLGEAARHGARASHDVSWDLRPAVYRPRLNLPAIAAVVAAIITAVSSAPAQAATNVAVRPGVCSVAYSIVPGAAYGAGVNLVYGTHSATKLKLYGKYSWGWKRNARGQVTTPSRVYNSYDVRFLDFAGRAVWQQANAIPNGGSRVFSVGANVKTIQVRAQAYSWGWAVNPAVSYDSTVR